MSERSTGAEKKREIKVQVPVKLILQLQALKVAHGVLIADAVEEALRAYLAREKRGGASTEDAEQPVKEAA